MTPGVTPTLQQSSSVGDNIITKATVKSNPCTLADLHLRACSQESVSDASVYVGMEFKENGGLTIFNHLGEQLAQVMEQTNSTAKQCLDYRNDICSLRQNELMFRKELESANTATLELATRVDTSLKCQAETTDAACRGLRAEVSEWCSGLEHMQQNVTTIDEQVNMLTVQVRERLAGELDLREQIKNVMQLVQQERTERLQEAEVVRVQVKELSAVCSRVEEGSTPLTTNDINIKAHLLAANERHNSETQRRVAEPDDMFSSFPQQLSEHRVAEKEFEKIMPPQEEALTTINDTAASSRDDFDRKTDTKENSLNRFNEELEMHRKETQDALAQEMACRESGLNELHEKMHRSKMDVDNIARLLWDAIEMHTHNICIDDVVRGRGLEHLDIQQLATPGLRNPRLRPAQKMVVARPSITRKQTAGSLRARVPSRIAIASPAPSWTPSPRIAVAAAPLNIVAPRLMPARRSVPNVAAGQVSDPPIPVTITRSSSEAPHATDLISL